MSKNEKSSLKPPYGWNYFLACFNKKIFNNNEILYIWITPEQTKEKAFQKEKERKKGKSPTVSTKSSLNHIGEIVHDKEYGTKEFDYLISKSPGKNYIPIVKDDVFYKIIGEKLIIKKT